jgi:hypothetical protein
MSRNCRQRYVECDLGGASRPTALLFDQLQPFQKAAHIHQNASKVGTGCIQRPVHSLAGGHEIFRHV